MDDIWFQQDGTTCHTANVTIDLLRTVFENRIINQNSDVNCPPQSCDLTSLDYFLWGAVKDMCYTNHPETIEALKHEIEVAIHALYAKWSNNSCFAVLNIKYVVSSVSFVVMMKDGATITIIFS